MTFPGELSVWTALLRRSHATSMLPPRALPHERLTRKRVGAVGFAVGLVMAGGVSAIAQSAAERSVWDGVFTEAQAARGQAVYEGACELCHGYRLNGAPDDPDMRSTPPLARARFDREWDGRSLGALFTYTQTRMPEENPESLADQEVADVIAYMLSVGGKPTGSEELPADSASLSGIRFAPKP